MKKKAFVDRLFSQRNGEEHESKREREKEKDGVNARGQSVNESVSSCVHAFEREKKK